MYKEALYEFEKIASILNSEDLEVYANEVLAELEKEAGTGWGIVAGIPAGMVAGIAAGNFLGKHKAQKIIASMPKEEQELRSNLDADISRYQGMLNSRRKQLPDLEDIRHSLEDDIYGSISSEDFDNMTVKEYEDLGRKYLKEQFRSALSKQASFKGGFLGASIPISLLYGGGMYNSSKEPQSISSKEDQISNYKKQYNDVDTAIRTGDLSDSIIGKYIGGGHHGVFNAAQYLPDVEGFACEDKSYYGEEVDAYLKKNNIDRDNMKMKDYAHIVREFNKNLYEDNPYDVIDKIYNEKRV